MKYTYVAKHVMSFFGLELLKKQYCKQFIYYFVIKHVHILNILC